jgi:hypothetical protein
MKDKPSRASNIKRIKARMKFNDKVYDAMYVIHRMNLDKDVLLAVAKTILAGRRLYHELPQGKSRVKN